MHLNECEHDMWQNLREDNYFVIGIKRALYGDAHNCECGENIALLRLIYKLMYPKRKLCPLGNGCKGKDEIYNYGTSHFQL